MMKIGREFSDKKSTGRNILILIVIIIILFALKNRISSSFSFLDGITKEIDFKLVKVKNLTLKYPGHFGTNIDFDIYKTDLDKDNKPYTLIYRADKLSYARDKNLKIEYKIGSDWSSMPLDIRDKNGDCTGTCGPYDDSYVTYEPFTETSPAHIHFYCACYKDQIEEIRFTLPMIRDTISERRVIKRNDHDSKLLPDYFEHREILTMKVPKK